MLRQVVRRAPYFIASRIPSVIDGIIAAYVVALLFLGPFPWLRTIGGLCTLLVVCYCWLRALRWLVAAISNRRNMWKSKSDAEAVGQHPHEKFD
jgi:ABC-type transport system involved in Fe-S cluster assembly fused permease/ATPase subunit